MGVPIINPNQSPNTKQPTELSKENLVAQAEERRLKKQLKEVLWPFLEMSSKDLTEAVNFLDVIKLGIEGAWTQKKNKATLNSLDMEKQANKTTEDWKKVKFVLDTLKDETVAGAINILTSMKNLINEYGSEQISKQPMNSLKEQFEKEFRDV